MSSPFSSEKGKDYFEAVIFLFCHIPSIGWFSLTMCLINLSQICIMARLLIGGEYGRIIIRYQRLVDQPTGMEEIKNN